MATVYAPPLQPEWATFLSTTFPEFKNISGTNIPVLSLAFDAALDEAAFWRIPIVRYGSGNLTCVVYWYADTASSGDIVWEAAIAAITPDADTQDIETDSLATIQKVTDSHLGTTGQRLHQASITISNLDSLAALDDVAFRIRRLGNSDAADTMTGDALLVRALISYSDV